MIPPVIIFFSNNVPLGERFLFYVLSITQNLFTIYLMITLFDFFEVKAARYAGLRYSL